MTAGAVELLGETDERRIRAIRSRRWVLYPRAKQALDRLSRLLEVPQGTRMPSVAIYGDSGMGKTMIMKRFREEHPPSFNPTTGKLRTPVLAMEMTSRPGERRFYAELLTLLGAPQRPRADIARMEQAALRIMKAIGVQVLVIDEVHNIRSMSRGFQIDLGLPQMMAQNAEWASQISGCPGEHGVIRLGRVRCRLLVGSARASRSPDARA
jgi:hypothetical protein